MSRAIGALLAIALLAAAGSAQEDRSAYLKAQARLTEQLNAVIADGVVLDPHAPPAKRDDGDEVPQKPADRRASR